MKRIKLNIKTKVLSAVAVATAFFIGAVPITAYAGGYECICENHKCTEDCINEDCELCKIDYKLCCGEDKEPESEEPETEIVDESGPLTPDGNMTLVDDYGPHEKTGKQFITVVTKSGNYFYIIIDRDDNGTETVHFLNMVDEADLLALMDDEAVEQYMAAKEAGEEQTEPTVTEPTETPEETETPTEPEEPKKKSNAGVLGIVLILALGGAGAYVYFTKFKGKKTPQNDYVDPDADYDENEDLLEGLSDEVEEILAEEEEGE